MREILGSGRTFTWPLGLLKSLGWRRRNAGPERSAPLDAALACAERWHWPVLPGVGHRHEHPAAEDTGRTRRGADGRGVDGHGADSRGVDGHGADSRGVDAGGVDGHGADARGADARVADARGRGGGRRRGDRRTEALVARRPRPCACPRPDCVVPGAHPHDPGLLAATTDRRMVEWWWSRRPDAPVLVATGDPVSAVSLPAAAGARAVAALEDLGVRLGPVISTPTRTVLLVAPYSLEELGDLLSRQEWVPSSLRYHGHGGYVVLPPSRTGDGAVCWAREPRPGPDGTPYLPDITVIVDMLVAAGAGAPDGQRLTY